MRRTGFRDTRVLVTGGRGFLGRHLVRALRARGARVHVFAGDLRVLSDVRRAVEVSRPRLVFHLASRGVDPRVPGSREILETNVLGVAHLLDSLVDVPYERFVNTGSCFEYGNATSGLEPLNVYAASKTAAMHLCNVHARVHGKPVVTLRPFTFFGPHERPDRLIPSVIRSVLSKRPIRITAGKQTRDYTYVEDVVDAFLRAATADEAIGETIDVGSGKDRSVLEVVERIRELAKSDVPVEVGAMRTRADEVWKSRCDPSRARRLLGWKPALSFDEGIRRTIRWLRRRRGTPGTTRSCARGQR